MNSKNATHETFDQLGNSITMGTAEKIKEGNNGCDPKYEKE